MGWFDSKFEKLFVVQLLSCRKMYKTLRNNTLEQIYAK